MPHLKELENERLQLANYCERNLRQKTNFPSPFLEASYEELISFLKREGHNVETIFLEIFLEETPDPLDDSK